MQSLLSPLLRLSLAFVFLLGLLPLAWGVHLSGEVISSSTFVYLAKFAYAESGGNFSALTASLAGPSAASSPLLLLYPDVDGLWSSASSSDTTCEQKAALSMSRQDSAPIGEFLDVGVWGHRPHWWYIAVSDCNSSSGLAVSYDFTFSNGGGAWVSPVSYNEQHIAETSLTFLLYYLLMLAVVIAAISKASTAAASTPRPQLVLLAGAVCLVLLSCLLTFAEFATLIHTNTQRVALWSAAYFFLHAAHCVLIVSILLTCFGFPTLTRHLRPLPVALIAAQTAAFAALYITAFCVQQAQPAWSTQFVFNNGAGYALALLYAVVLLPLCLLLLYRNGQSRLYSAYVTLYFLSFPFIVLGASLADSWWVAKAEYAASGCVLVLALTAQLAFYQPFYNKETAGKQSFSTLHEESVRKHSSSVLGTSSAVGADGAVELSVSEAHVVTTSDSDGAVVPV